MKCVDKELWDGFKLQAEIEHFAVVEAQYSWGWRLPIDYAKWAERYLKAVKT